MSKFLINQRRRCGVLLHITSLPSGRFDDVPRWLDWMAETGFSVWQILPLGVPQDDLSPYQCLSAFAVNAALLPESVVNEPVDPAELDRWYRQQSHWLDDYALFMVLRRQHNNDPWFSWPQQYRKRDSIALIEFSRLFRDDLDLIVLQQYRLYRSWNEIRAAAHARDIQLFGDMPIFVAHDSADVWANPQQFMLDETGQPTFVTGVPPDYFSETGQRWGNPQYNWEQMEQDGFRFWIDRLHHHFEWFDLVRLDHFRGLESVWMIPAENESAVDGYWQKVPGAELLSRLQQEMGAIPLVAEDLGVITREVTALRDQYHLPGMAVLQFGFDAFEDNPHKLHNIHENTVVYTGTHDNDTILGWYASLDEQTQAHVRQAINAENDDVIVQRMIDAAINCKASLAMLPMQDLLELGNEARMNVPGTTAGNWSWRFDWHQLDAIDKQHYTMRMNTAGRLGDANA